jgi:hypothetical protein
MDTTTRHGSHLPGNADDKLLGDAARKIANDVFTARVLALGLAREDSADERKATLDRIIAIEQLIDVLRTEVDALKARASEDTPR